MGNTVKDIENAVRQLPNDQLQQFHAWFERYAAKKWDEQIESDALAGRLDSLADRALADHKSGKSKKL